MVILSTFLTKVHLVRFPPQGMDLTIPILSSMSPESSS